MPYLIDEGSSDEASSDSDLPPLLNPDEVSDEEDDENDFPPKPKAASVAKKPTTAAPSPLYGDTKAVEVVDTHAQYSRVLLKYREGRWDDALASLYVAFFCNPHVIYYLTSRRSLPAEATKSK